MRKIIPILLALASLTACTVKLSPRKPATGHSPSSYVAVINLTDPRPDLRQAQFLFTLKTIDRGWSRDCLYPDVVEQARQTAMPLGANFMVITQRILPENERSSCNRIQAQLYYMPDLAGMENEITWSPARPLAGADLKGKPGGKTPAVHCTIRYRLLGDFFNSMTIRTITTFYADSTGIPEGPLGAALGLRRAQLIFNLAELSARNFKRQIQALAPNVNAMTTQAKTLEQTVNREWQERSTAFDNEFAGAANQSEVLDRWEKTVAGELAASAGFAENTVIDLHPKKQSKRQ